MKKPHIDYPINDDTLYRLAPVVNDARTSIPVLIPPFPDLGKQGFMNGDIARGNRF